MKQIKHPVNILTIVCFFTCLFIPLVLFNFKSDQISEIDNTKLIELNEIGAGPDKEFTSDIEKCVNQRIGLRTKAIDLYQIANDKLFGILTHPTYTYGKDGYVFFKMPKENLDKDYLKSFASFIKGMEDDLTNRGIDFLYCINPNKTVAYKDYLPDGANLTFERQNYLVKCLDKLKVNYIDNTDLLIEASKSTDVFNKKFDAGHWNETGAIIGMNNILSKLNEMRGDVIVGSFDDYKQIPYNNAYLPLSHFPINEDTYVYERINPNTVDVTADDTDIILDENYRDYSHFINPAHPEYPKILIFRGSYFLGKEKFMNESFSESIFVHSYMNVFNYNYYVERFNPDIVLFESVEYATIKKYYPAKMMK